MKNKKEFLGWEKTAKLLIEDVSAQYLFIGMVFTMTFYYRERVLLKKRDLKINLLRSINCQMNTMMKMILKKTC